MAAINVRRSTMVRPIEPTQRCRLWISNVDLVAPRVHQESVYFYRPNGSSDFFDAAQLRDALARVLVPFYPVAGRIAKDEAGRMEIDCNDEGVLFIEVDSGASVDDFGDFSPTAKLKHLIPNIDYTNDVSSCPLLLLQGDDVPPSAAKIFKLTREQLDLMKRHCRLGAAYSTYVALAAHVWQCVCIARELRPDQVTQLYIAVDGRHRLCPPVKKGYFGNVIFVATPLATAGEMSTGCTDKGHIRVATSIHEAIARMDDEYMRSALDYLEVQPNLDALARGSHQHQSPDFRFTSWAHLPIHDADFKWGRPVFMGPGCMSHEGMAYVLPSSTHDGRLYLAICLKPRDMLKFQTLI